MNVRPSSLSVGTVETDYMHPTQLEQIIDVSAWMRENELARRRDSIALLKMGQKLEQGNEEILAELAQQGTTLAELLRALQVSQKCSGTILGPKYARTQVDAPADANDNSPQPGPSRARPSAPGRFPTLSRARALVRVRMTRSRATRSRTARRTTGTTMA